MATDLLTNTDRPHTPMGYLVKAMEQQCTDLDQIREKYPLVFSAYTDKDMFAMVKNCIAVRGADGAPAAARVIIMDEHVRREHGANATPHEHGVMGEPKHDHDKELNRYREEVKTMPTATKERSAKRTKVKEKKEKAERTKRACHCGCGGETFGNFCPGHDARVYGLLRKEADKEHKEKVTLPKVLTDNAELLKEMRGKVH